jgi:hypothetical protein
VIRFADSRERAESCQRHASLHKFRRTMDRRRVGNVSDQTFAISGRSRSGLARQSIELDFRAPLL